MQLQMEEASRRSKERQNEMDHNTQYEPQNGNRASFCLGHPSHALQQEEVICRVCGALAAQTILGAYQVQKLLGIGRSGRAYLAQHQGSSQPVTIKLSPSQTANPELWEAARREVRMTTALRHNSIRSVFSCTTWSLEQKMRDGSSPNHMRQASASNMYLMTLCQFIPGTLEHFVAYLQKGENQRALYEKGHSPRTLLIHVLQQIGMAAHTAHTRGTVHGAIIPGNVLFTSYERAWLADFGLARLQPAPSPYLAPELYTAAQASQQGNVQAYWNAVNPASDQYMFAILCQQLFTQTLPRQEYEALLPIINRATHPKPERRYPSVELLVQDLMMLTSRSAPQPSQMQTQSSSGAHLMAAGSMSGTASRGPISMHSSSGQSFTPIPGYAAGPLTPSLPATPLTPAIPLTAEDWEKRGDKLFTLHDYEEALKSYHRAVEVNGDRAHIWLALGDTYFALGRHKEALMAYEQAVYLNPNDPQTWANRGTALDELGRHREALDCYERSEQLRSA
jgi:tetratricopeptide (TPR) repeat protein